MSKKNRTAGLVAGLLLIAAPAAGAATVTMRVEAADRTLVREVAVQPSPSVTVDKTAEGGTTCDGTTAAGALELATAGDWGGRADQFGQRVEHILGTSLLFEDGRFWSFYVNNAPSYSGVCSFTPQEGDELLLAASCAGATTGCFSGDPLEIRAPERAAPGTPFTVEVDEYTVTYGDTSASATPAPSEGATVTAGGVTTTTDAQGRAQVTVPARGPVEVVATKGGRIRDEATVCVTDGADGSCGTAAPAPAGAPAPAPCVTTGDDGLCGTRDRRAPQARITGIAEQERFRRADAPRLLTGIVADDPSGLHSVKLRLTRRHRGRCWYFSGRRERFRRVRCGRSYAFRIGDRADWSYLLPSELGPGRYVLDAVAIDRAFNRDPLARGRNRVVFRVS